MVPQTEDSGMLRMSGVIDNPGDGPLRSGVSDDDDDIREVKD